MLMVCMVMRAVEPMFIALTVVLFRTGGPEMMRMMGERRYGSCVTTPTLAAPGYRSRCRGAIFRP